MLRFLFFCALVLPVLICAQPTANNTLLVPKEYSYSGDRMFSEPDQFIGMVFFPNEGKLATSPMSSTVKLGLVGFKITSLGLVVVENVKFSTTGITSETDFKNYKLSIPRTDATDFGYEMTLMDMRNPDIQGYLKLYKNGKGQIERLGFRPTISEPERMYFVGGVPADIDLRDSKFFTHTQDIEMAVPNDLWGRKQVIFPFSKLTKIEDYQDFSRVFPSDRVKITFEERTEIKNKKEKLTQFILFYKANSEGTEIKTEYQIKKMKEVSNPQNKTAPKNIVLEVAAGSGEEVQVIILHRTAQNTLKAIEVGGMIYQMRDGKRKAK
jgi:hypothetical protein